MVPHDLQAAMRAPTFGTPCPQWDKDVGCLHYENRPAVCRDFEVGSVDCFYERKLAGLMDG